MTKGFWPTTLTALALGWALPLTDRAVPPEGPGLAEPGLNARAPGLDAGARRPETARVSQRGGLEIDPNG